MFPFEQLASGMQTRYFAPLLCVPVEHVLSRQAENEATDENVTRIEIRMTGVNMAISLIDKP
jgi:hypothetical protein